MCVINCTCCTHCDIKKLENVDMGVVIQFNFPIILCEKWVIKTSFIILKYYKIKPQKNEGE